MKNTIMINLIAAVSIYSASAIAGSKCMGETRSGKIVSVSVKTLGSMGFTDSAVVEVKDKKSGRIEKTYDIPRENISQYAETVRGPNYTQAIVVMSAYAHTLWPISIDYIGKDFFSETDSNNGDLETWLLSTSRAKQKGNRMEVWDGNQDYTGQYSSYKFQDIVCELDHDV